MSEKERQILETIAKAVPQMSERQKGRLLGYGEAILDMREIEQMQEKSDECRNAS